jgi:hypothetical protein
MVRDKRIELLPYTHVLFEQKKEGMKLMESLYNITPVVPSDGRQFYPIIVSAEEDGSYTITSPDFPAIQFSAPTLEYGLQSVPELLQDEMTGMVYPPVPTPTNQITVPPGAFLVQIVPAC